ncbi:hypothetical protein CBER1_04166 [Cercospora berteroae]|uniref:NmrA-like domain-containing protein n=1 Tax=Cercospora berteroae TaxID=357750 RepID=A0A2S6CN12_9PEZI|nr:hypothetical protein CBER1_04166 [Cercospora berteroae]
MPEQQKITVFGAGGDNIGRFILDALVADPAFEVAVLSRRSSKSQYPSSVMDLRVSDDLPHAELVDLLKGQHAVISAVGYAGGALDIQYKVIDAAIEAGVARFFPSEYAFDYADPLTTWLSPVFASKTRVAEYLEEKAKGHPEFSWTGVACVVWLEWALETKFLDIDPTAHTVSYWDGGNHAPTFTTLQYAAHAVLECLKHPKQTANLRVYVEAFSATQQEIVAELEAQQGVKYKVLDPVNGSEAVAEAHKRLNESENQDRQAALRTIVAEVWVAKYGANFIARGKKPHLEDLVQMPKVTLQDVVKKVVKGSW